MLLVAHRTLVDLAAYIFMTRQAKVLSYKISALPYGLLLTQFLHVMLIPKCAEELKGHPLMLVNKTTLSRSMAQTHRQQVRAVALRRQEQPPQFELGQSQLELDLGTSDEVTNMGRSLGGGLKIELSATVPVVMHPTLQVLSDISDQLTALETKVNKQDSQWKKEVESVRSYLKVVATLKQLQALMRRVEDMEKYMKKIRDVLALMDE